MQNSQTLKGLVQGFKDFLELELGRSPHTIKNYTLRLEQFLQFSQIEELPELTLDKVTEYRRYLIEQGKSRRTVNCHLVALKSFLKFARQKDYMALNPGKIILSQVPDGSIDFLDKEEVNKIISTATLCDTVSQNITTLRDQAILLFLSSSGLRVSEMLNLNKDDIDFGNRTVRIINGKMGKSGYGFFSDQASQTLQDYLKARADDLEAVFVSHARNCEAGRLSVSAVQKTIKVRADMAGIDKNVSPHSFRRFFACSLLSSGVSTFYIQKLLRHSSLSSTQRYLNATNDELKAVYNQYCQPMD